MSTNVRSHPRRRERQSGLEVSHFQCEPAAGSGTLVPKHFHARMLVFQRECNSFAQNNTDLTDYIKATLQPGQFVM